MRDILFKAKRKDNGEWIEGYYYKRIQEGNVVDAIETYDGNIHSIEYYEIDPKTLCQYTGLKDKKGDKIWENDILHGEFHGYPVTCIETFKVKWHKEDAGFLVNYFSPKNCEVIGNIFDNQELIKD